MERIRKGSDLPKKIGGHRVSLEVFTDLHCEPENDGFHKQNFETINRAKVNLSMSDINFR